MRDEFNSRIQSTLIGIVTCLYACVRQINTAFLAATLTSSTARKALALIGRSGNWKYTYDLLIQKEEKGERETERGGESMCVDMCVRESGRFEGGIQRKERKRKRTSR